MTAIADGHPGEAGPVDLDSLPARLSALMARQGAHAARTVVLVPFAQLMPLARQAWARHCPDGFCPRFETTLNWASRSGFSPGPDDLSFDRAQDLLTARALVERAGLGRHAGVLAPRLVDAAWQVASVAAAVDPADREGWALQARAAGGLGLDHPVLALEAALAQIAIAWAASSSYATDRLFEPAGLADVDLLVLLEGLQPDPVARAIARRLGGLATCWPLDTGEEPGETAAAPIALHACDNAAQEAERAAACVLQHLAEGRQPVALAAVDRVLTRRVRAMLATHGVRVADETGWKLSTTRAAALVMATLRVARWDAASDEVLDWLKHLPAVPPEPVQALERQVRREGLRSWSQASPQRLGARGLRSEGDPGGPAWVALLAQVTAWRERLRQPRPLAAWQQALREVLQAVGAWPALEADAAGAQLVAALGLDEAGQSLWARLPQAARRLSLDDLTAWVGDALEAASYVPDPPPQAQVVVLPFNQLLARPFAALVVPGCDETRLAPSPEPPGPWTAAQREALGLPSRDSLERSLRAGWRAALGTPRVDLLWRVADAKGEPVLPSPLVQEVQLRHGLVPVADTRPLRLLDRAPVGRPAPGAASLVVAELSASAYGDLRACPYRFFALHQLGLREQAEIEADLDKRDFGTWLHEVLRRFHEAMAEAGELPHAQRAALMDRCAGEALQAQHLQPADFLPFQAGWPALREGYLTALAQFEAKERARFERAEAPCRTDLGGVRLVGRIDRIDRLPEGRRAVLDYKTEGLERTRDRVRDPLEDTQIAFYAALLADDAVDAWYVNVGERGQTRFVAQPEVQAARAALEAGILHDLGRIHEGAALPAMGEGRACEHCAARGICRKDFWGVP